MTLKRASLTVLCAILLYAVILALTWVAVMGMRPAHARDNGQWDNQPDEIRAWFQSVMQPDNPYVSCCGSGDAFEVTLEGDNPDGSIATVIVNGKGIIADGTPIDVPRSKIQAKYGNPLDHYILFINLGSGRPLCLIPKVGA